MPANDMTLESLVKVLRKLPLEVISATVEVEGVVFNISTDGDGDFFAIEERP